MPDDWWDMPDSPRFQWDQSSQAFTDRLSYQWIALNQIAGSSTGTPYVTAVLSGRHLLTDHPLDRERERRWIIKDLTVPAPDEDSLPMPTLAVEIRFWWRGAERHARYEWPLGRRAGAKNLLEVKMNPEVVGRW